jgi:2,3-bisphosphoglycerate-independent phosphoglycerate mutase
MRGVNLSPDLKDTDPQKIGVPPYPVKATKPEAEHTASLFNQWIAEARKKLSDQPKANGVSLRGFATDPALQSYQDAYGLRAACVAVYPMYRGLAKLVGMDIIQFEGESPEDEFDAVERNWEDYDFFFIHIKKPDSMGEDGDFEGKAKIIEEVDEALPRLLELNPDVLMITGDHSTPSILRSHSWHPVPFLLWTTSVHLPDAETHFGERACARGALGNFPATDTMPLALAHAGRIGKFGA